MRRRRAVTIFVVGVISIALLAGAMPRMIEESLPRKSQEVSQPPAETMEKSAVATLHALEVKGRAPKTGYSRDQFGDGWDTINGCTTRNIILYRDLENPTLDTECKVITGILRDPYTGETVAFTNEKSTEVQIDHVVALSDAWQKGAQLLTQAQREQLANDPLELLAVSGSQNQAKSDADAASWLPKNKAFRCDYVARQIAIKHKYALWVTVAERDAMAGVLASCPAQQLPSP